ncbi:hypothetical protein PROFUN_04639 [Planoprotostelium fungivorum]|uniref:Centrosomal protein of 44 kDa n=1 Tax=Planoprotostelium fungivorum TaxID=1890364 RepID=A0A2P6NUG1_9EUKA|nr:hypothetical protein PROFUN_04639 [Planoprotostelium fungivorum]
MTTGDRSGKLEQLYSLLSTLKFEQKIEPDSLLQGDSKSFVTIIQYVLLRWSRHVSTWISQQGYEMFGKSDAKFIESTYKLLRTEFAYHPSLTVNQFLSVGFSERKMLLTLEIIRLSRAKHQDLAKLSEPKKTFKGEINPRLLAKKETIEDMPIVPKIDKLNLLKTKKKPMKKKAVPPPTHHEEHTCPPTATSKKGFLWPTVSPIANPFHDASHAVLYEEDKENRTPNNVIHTPTAIADILKSKGFSDPWYKTKYPPLNFTRENRVLPEIDLGQISEEFMTFEQGTAMQTYQNEAQGFMDYSTTQEEEQVGNDLEYPFEEGYIQPHHTTSMMYDRGQMMQDHGQMMQDHGQMSTNHFQRQFWREEEQIPEYQTNSGRRVTFRDTVQIQELQDIPEDSSWMASDDEHPPMHRMTTTIPSPTSEPSVIVTRNIKTPERPPTGPVTVDLTPIRQMTETLLSRFSSLEGKFEASLQNLNAKLVVMEGKMKFFEEQQRCRQKEVTPSPSPAPTNLTDRRSPLEISHLFRSSSTSSISSNRSPTMMSPTLSASSSTLMPPVPTHSSPSTSFSFRSHLASLQEPMMSEDVTEASELRSSTTSIQSESDYSSTFLTCMTDSLMNKTRSSNERGIELRP